jgi:uncharacterized repeat protein (TIGR01451 family)
MIMKHTLFALAVLVGTTGTVHAQVFIPTQLERDWLNELIPGVVNGDGIMDTLHPGIGLVDTAAMLVYPEGPMDLYGVGYLSSLVDLQLDDYSSGEGNYTRCDRLPQSLRSLEVTNNSIPIALPALPPDMDRIVIFQNEAAINASTIHIENMPSSVGYMRVNDITTITWNGNPTIDRFRWDTSLNGIFNYYEPIVVPPCTVDRMELQLPSVLSSLDLSATTTNSLDISAYPLTGNIDWPSSLDSLIMNGEFPGMTEWPADLISLEIWSSNFVCIPTLPDALEFLLIEQSPDLDCLPNWPASLTPENFYTWLWEPGFEQFCSVLNTNCPGIYPGITGSIYADLNGNGIQDNGEFRPAGATILLQPGNSMVSCEADGAWEVGLAPGTYTITPSASYPYIQSFAPIEHTADVPNMGDIDTDNHFAVTLIPDIQDLQAWIYADPARPGFDNRLFLNCRNYGTIPVSTTLTLQWDGDQQWVGSSVTPTTLSGNTATWDLGTMAIAAEEQLTVDLSTLATVPLDTPIEHLLTAGPIADDETPDDNVSAFSDVVVGSYDPNDKLLTPIAMSPAQLQDPAARIEYTVRFQNTGTYLAERVVILDTLPEGVIPESIQFLASSHPNNWYLTGGVLHVIHNDIMLPDSTSDEPNSHGFIRFSIKPDPTLTNGSTIANIAHIVFDFNEAIITPPAVFTVDVLASVNEMQQGTLSLWPNPTRDVLRLTSGEGALSNEPCVVRDLTGRSVLTINTDAGGDLNVAALAKGAYTMQVTGQTEVLRFVKE